MKEAIEKSRQQQIQRKEAEKNMNVLEDKEFSALWRVRNEELVSLNVSF